MQHDELVVDGVRVHHFPAEEELTSVSLVFAAGAREESLPTAGSLHALEHLCLGAVRNTPLEINGAVDRLTTQFNAHGRTSLVGPWLERLCQALARPPVERLEAESSVLLAEGGGIGTPADPLALVRFGNRDLGLGLAPPPAPGRCRSRSCSPTPVAGSPRRTPCWSSRDRCPSSGSRCRRADPWSVAG